MSFVYAWYQKRYDAIALAGGEGVEKARREFEETIDKPVLNHGTGAQRSATASRTRDQEMALFRQASGSM